MINIIRVNIGDARVGKQPDHLFTVLGSCAAVMLYDKKKKIGGMLHLMLDYQKGRQDSIYKYADTGIPGLIRQMVENGASSSRLLGAKLAGGAMVLAYDHMNNIGGANVIAAKKVLNNLGIKVIAEDCGGMRSRRVTFDILTGKVQVEAPGRKKIIL